MTFEIQNFPAEKLIKFYRPWFSYPKKYSPSKHFPLSPSEQRQFPFPVSFFFGGGSWIHSLVTLGVEFWGGMNGGARCEGRLSVGGCWEQAMEETWNRSLSLDLCPKLKNKVFKHFTRLRFLELKDFAKWKEIEKRECSFFFFFP